MSKIYHAPGHTQDAFDVYMMPSIVKWAEEQCMKYRADAIVACGHSGLTIAGAVSYLARIPVFAVRKQGEPSRAYSPQVTAVTTDGKAKRWVWLDDFISSGATFRNAASEIWKAGVVEKPYPEVILSYGRSENDTYETAGRYLRINEIVAGAVMPVRIVEVGKPK